MIALEVHHIGWFTIGLWFGGVVGYLVCGLLSAHRRSP